MTDQTEVIKFHGDNITVIYQDGEPYIAAKPICERLGVDWSRQRKKINDPKHDWTVAQMYLVGASKDGKLREMTCIALFDFFLWLATIHPGKVAEEYREKVILYRRECKKVLFQHFFGQKSEQARLEAALAASHAHLLAQFPRWGKLVGLLTSGATEFLVYKRSNMTHQQFDAEMRELDRCGLLDPATFNVGGDETILQERERLRIELMVANSKLTQLEG